MNFIKLLPACINHSILSETGVLVFSYPFQPYDMPVSKTDN